MFIRKVASTFWHKALNRIEEAPHPPRQFLDGEGLADQFHALVDYAVVDDGIARAES